MSESFIPAFDGKIQDTSNILRLLLSSIDSAVLVTAFEPAGARVVFANGQYYEQLGYTQEEYAREAPDPFSFIHPEDRDHARELAQSCNEVGQAYSLAYRMVRRDGAIIWRQSRVSFVNFPGEPAPVQLSVASDVTALKEAELKSAAATARLHAIMDHVNCGITAITFNGDNVEYLMINDRYFDILGYTREEYDALEAFSPVYKDDRAPVMEASRQAYASGKTMTLEFRAVKRDGSVIWLRDSMTMTRFAGVDKPVQLSIFYDITSERQAARELLDNLPGGAALYEYNGDELKAIHINSRYWALVDRAPMDSAQHAALDAIHPEDKAITLREIAFAVSQGRDISCDIRLRYGKDGYRPFHIAGRVVPRGERLWSIYASYTPISDEAMSIQEMLPVAIKAMMDSSSEVSFVKGRDLRYVSCSLHFARLAGRRTEAELLGKNSYDVFPKSLAAQNDAVDREILKTGRSFVDEDILFPAGDGMLHLLFSKYPLLDSKGNVLGIYGTGHDVTETRKLQSQLELLTNNVPGGIAIYEGKPNVFESIRLTFFSDGLCRLFGYTREEYAARAKRDPLSLVHPADMPAMKKSIAALVSDGKPMDYIYRARVSDGSTKWINIKAVMGEPDGELLTVNAVLFDVTEQRNATERLRVSEEVNRLAIEHSGSTVCRYDIASGQLRVSPNMDPIFGISPLEENVPEKPLREGQISPTTAEAYSAFYGSILRGDESGEVLFQRRSTLGWRWIRERFTTIFTDSGEPATAVITFADVTESVEAEQDIIERAETDPLTGLLNRKTFAQRVDELIRASKRDSMHALLMIDIDDFKLVNDFFGHSAGDQTLTDIAEILSSNSRRGDLVGRLGGDEFLVFLTDISSQTDAARKARLICSATRKTLSAEVRISGSVGIALCPADGGDFESLYKKADDALYYVKGTGKNSYAFYGEDMKAGDERRARRQLTGKRAAAPAKKRRMLIADDSPIDRELLGNMFSGDYIIEYAQDGGSALSKLMHFGSAISIVLLDLVMPGTDGFAVLERMQLNENTRDIPVIVVSAADEVEASLAAVRAGATDFAPKPVDPAIMRIRVESAVCKAENERLRARNSFLELRAGELAGCMAALERVGMCVMAYEPLRDAFVYSSSVETHIAGRFDERTLWDILSDDSIADRDTVLEMKRLILDIADDRTRADAGMTVTLVTPSGEKRPFTMDVFRQSTPGVLNYGLIIAFREA